MTHFAKLDENNIVTFVVKGRQEDDGREQELCDRTGETYRQTSYNTHGGVHTQGGTPFRMNFAGIGYIYDEQRDAFIPRNPHSAWILDESTLTWGPPFPKPDDAVINGGTKVYDWDEDTNDWKEIG